jgi:hypothetical protein
MSYTLGSKEKPYKTLADAHRGNKKFTRWYGDKSNLKKLEVADRRPPKKRSMNEFFKKMLAAKHRGDESFPYKGQTYVKVEDGHLTFYRARGMSRLRKRSGMKRRKASGYFTGGGGGVKHKKRSQKRSRKKGSTRTRCRRCNGPGCSCCR